MHISSDHRQQTVNLVTSTFWDQLNSYGEKSMRPRHIMVTSTMPNSLGEGCISLVLKPDILDNDWAFTNGNWCLTARHVDQLLRIYHITRNHSWQSMGQNSFLAMNSMVWQRIQHSQIWFKWRPDWANVYTQTQGHKLNPTTQEFLSPWPKHTDLPNCKPTNFYLFDRKHKWSLNISQQFMTTGSARNNHKNKQKEVTFWIIFIPNSARENENWCDPPRKLHRNWLTENTKIDTT